MGSRKKEKTTFQVTSGSDKVDTILSDLTILQNNTKKNNFKNLNIAVWPWLESSDFGPKLWHLVNPLLNNLELDLQLLNTTPRQDITFLKESKYIYILLNENIYG